jgi:hypothetical protein
MSTVSVNPPEINLANLVIKRNELKPGFNVKKLLSSYAELKFGSIPNNADGISLNLKSKRPIVFISSSIPPVRQQFTMAHELGHIVIPWHIGAIISHTEENHKYTSRLYHDCEVEANRFAAELLMPSCWVKEILDEFNPTRALQIISSTAGTSQLATFYKMASHLPIAHTGILTDNQNNVITSVSQNSRLQLPNPKSIITDQAIFKSASSHNISKLNSFKIYWLEHETSQLPDTKDDSRNWREVLYPIIEELKLDRIIIGQISGCLAFINRPNIMHDEFFEQATKRISSDNRFFNIYQHPNFNLFLVRKINDLIKNRKNND